MAYKITVAATTEPVSLAEARKHLRIEPFGSPEVHPDDDQIEMFVQAAREWCEQYTRRALAVQTIEVVYDDFPENDMELPLTPTNSITSITYINEAGSQVTVSNSVYSLDDYSKPNWVLLRSNQSWPVTSGGANNVKITAVVGNNTTNIPFAIKAAILLIVGNLYENRQEDLVGSSRNTFNSLPMGVYNLLQPYRLELGV
jgi:uncharacterized phiE125 gp8 family phage protein